MKTERICPSCQKPLPADAPQGLCPECLARVALGSGVPPAPLAADAPTTPAPAIGFDAEAPSLDEVARLFPQLEILELLGQGGMGVVYKARQRQLDRVVALKIMLPQFSRDPAFVERFNREARALARLNHPNIVAIYDFGQTPLPAGSHPLPVGRGEGPLCFFIMEFVDGANLRHLIQSGQLKPVEALAIVPKICEALQFAHDEGVVHRDIKPANILIDKKGRVKIADFGLAKLAGATDVSLTRSQQGMGTPQYMAPEQLENAKSVDHRADIYSLGVVFYEMLTGELPLGRFDPPSARVQVDVRLDEIVLKALERRPERRYQQASEVRTQVESLTSSPSFAPIPPTASPNPAPAGQENPVVAFSRFATTPQPGYLRQVGIPILILTAVWMAAMIAVAFLVPEKNHAAREQMMGAGFVGIPLVILFLSLRWKINRDRHAAAPEVGALGEPPAMQFVRSMLWLAVVVGSVMFCWFDIRRSALRPEDGGVATTVVVGAVQPWLTLGFRGGYHSISPDFATVSGLAGIGALMAIFALFSFRLSKPAKAHKPAPSTTELLAQIKARGIEMMIAGLALAISGLIGFLFGVRTAANYANTVTNPADNVASRAALGAMLFIPLFLGGIAAFIASLGMRKLRWHPFALVMSILLMLVLPGVVIANHAPPPQLILFQVAYAFYAGLRAFLLLRRREVEEVFSAQGGDSSRATPAPETGVSSGATSVPQRPRNLLSAALAVLCLFGFFLGFAFNAKWTATEAGRVEILTIGALDPLYIKESGPSGFRSSLNFFSWSFFAVMVAGVSLSALFRLGKEDQGKAPRDSAWWRGWWKQVGIWGGLVLIACIVRTALNPEKVLQPPGDRTVASRFTQLFNSGAEIRVDRSQLPATATPGRRDFAFTFNAPSNHVLNVWLEFWKDGKLEIPTSFSESYLPARGDSVRGGLHLITQDGDMAGVGSAGQMRFDWALSRHARVVSDISKLDSKSTSSSGQWRTNAFKELMVRGISSSQVSWDDQSAPTVWRPKPGEVTTVLAWTAHAGKSVSSTDLKWTEEGLAKGTPMVAILLRVRFDPVTPDKLSVAPLTKMAAIDAKNRGPKSQLSGVGGGPVAPLEVKQDRSQIPATRTVGRQDYAFKFAGPAGHTLDVWLESWRDGQREVVGRFAFRAKPKLGEPLDAALWLQTMDGDVASVESKGQVRFDWGMSCGSKGAGERNGAWRTNIFKGCSSISSSWDNPASATLRAPAGQTITVLEVLGYSDGQLGGWSEESLRKGSPTAALLIRARLNPAQPGELSPEGHGLGNGALSRAGPVAPPSKTTTVIEQAFMIGYSGPELTTEAITKLKLSKLQTDEINRILLTYHRDYLALQRRHSKVGKDAAGRILVTIKPFYDECLALAQRLQTELGGIVDPALLPMVKNGELPFQIFNWGGACNATITLWKTDGKYFVEEKLTAAPGHPRDPFTFNISGPELEKIPPQFRIYWREE